MEESASATAFIAAGRAQASPTPLTPNGSAAVGAAFSLTWKSENSSARDDAARDPPYRRARRATVASPAVNRRAVARLHRVAKNAVQAETAFDDTVRPGERLVVRLPVAALANQPFVVPGPAVKKRSVHAGRQRRIVHRLGGVPHLDGRFGGHESDALADHAHAVMGQKSVRPYASLTARYGE